jgi:hypothetical protein
MTTNDFNYEFEIYLPGEDLPTYQYNNSPQLTQDFIDFLEDIDIDIHNSIYKVTKI